jgi:hypothetical protein
LDEISNEICDRFSSKLATGALYPGDWVQTPRQRPTQEGIAGFHERAENARQLTPVGVSDPLQPGGG